MRKKYWIALECNEIDEDFKKGYTEKAFKKIKNQFVKPSNIKNADGKILINANEIKTEWKNIALKSCIMMNQYIPRF